jgi:N-acetylglutamate synthase-like GNAT family acetyltransferase
MPEVTVRFAVPADLEFLRQHSYAPSHVVERKVEWQEFLVAERSGSLVGCLQLEYLWSLVPYVALIWVLPAHRRQGVGRAMLRYAETFLRDKGHDALYSSSQADEPEPQAWHRHVGFEECGVISGLNEGGIGEIFFRKRL